MGEVRVWRSVEVAEQDACSDCGSHPELCDCDGFDPLDGDD